MKLNHVVPLLWTTDLDRSVTFYHDLLGFECLNRMPNWALLRKDGIEWMLSLPNAHEPFDKIHFTGSFYFHPDDVDDAWRQLKDKAEVVYPIENFDYGMREFAIRDNNGYILQFGQQI
ncbi:MAG TPA: VOC family protein [Candidatus Sulfotelmatobacter sp.]